MSFRLSDLLLDGLDVITFRFWQRVSKENFSVKITITSHTRDVMTSFVYVSTPNPKTVRLLEVARNFLIIFESKAG